MVSCGRGLCVRTVPFCSGGVALSCTPGPSAVELCDGEDNDCDGVVDNGVMRPCYSGPTATNGVGVCHSGAERCSDGHWNGVCSGQIVPTPEVCDGRDEDCNGSVDNGVSCDDGNPCTSDVCAGASGCQRTNLSGSSCGTSRWCYRGICTGRFVDTGGGTVIDLNSSLEWQQVGWGANFGASGNRPQYFCAGCTDHQGTSILPGMGWRAPTGAQLGSLREGVPCTVPSLFSLTDNSVPNTYWTSDWSGCSSPQVRYWNVCGSYCDVAASNAANCRCVRPWSP